MFLKRRKMWIWMCCILSAFLISMGLSLTGEKEDDNVYETAVYAVETTEMAEVVEIESYMNDVEEHETSTGYGSAKFNKSKIPHIVGPVLVIVGVIFAIPFIFMMRQERPGLGPDIEIFLLLFGIFLLFGAMDFDFLIKFVYLWSLLLAILISARGLWSWIWKGLLPTWSMSHRLGMRVASATRKQSRYLLFQLAWCFLSLARCLLFFAMSGENTLNILAGVGCIPSVILSVCCFLKVTRDMDHLSDQIFHLYKGETVSVRPGLFADHEEKLIDLNHQREEAVHTAVVSERFKVELISNVSHDLRTPLTSILGYSELLKAEKLTPQGEQQLEELNRKAGYMMDLVDSLFELTKVSSGAVENKEEQIDLIRLLEQTLGLFDDKLKERNLQVRRHYCEDSILIVTDGARLHQVFANLIGNAIKYALSGTRIHLEVKGNPKEMTIRMVNIASYEMDFDPAEIMERFVRGDNARTTSGSGLGLAIARTYTESVGGTFQIEIDGEQFIAVVTLPKR